MKFPSILIKREKFNSLLKNDFDESIIDQMNLPLLSHQNLENAEVNIGCDSMLIPPRIYLKYIFIERHNRSECSYFCTSSEEDISDDDQLITDLKENLSFTNELKEFLSDFVALIKSPGFHRMAEGTPDCLDPNDIHEYELLVNALNLVRSIGNKYLQYGYLDHQAMSTTYLLFRELHSDKTFNPVPYIDFDKPKLQLSSRDSATVTYKEMEHSQDQCLDDIHSNLIGCGVSFYIIQYDTQMALSILDHLSRNNCHLKRCAVCGKPFIVSKYRRKYCSEECRNNVEIKAKQNLPTPKDHQKEDNYRQRFYKSYIRFHDQNNLAEFDLKKMNIPDPEQRGTSAQQQILNKKRTSIYSNLESYCKKRYNRKGFRQAINELISYQQLRRDWGFISQKEYEDWLDNSKISSKVGRKPVK